jgi:hypothetical protein
MARSILASTSCRLMLRRFEQIPRSRALKHTNLSRDDRIAPPDSPDAPRFHGW